MLLSVGLSLPTRILVNGYLTAGGRKISNATHPVLRQEGFARWKLKKYFHAVITANKPEATIQALNMSQPVRVKPKHTARNVLHVVSRAARVVAMVKLRGPRPAGRRSSGRPPTTMRW